MSGKTVYVGMVGDLLHAGHLNILSRAKSLGKVIVGVFTDDVVVKYKRLPILPYEVRKALVENIAGISKVVAQTTHSYRPNLELYRPDFLIHGDDWRSGAQETVREEAIQTISSWNGRLVEIPYTDGVSSTMAYESLKSSGIIGMAAARRLRRMLAAKKFVRLIEAHNSISASIGETANASGRQFDGFWSSSLTDSTARGRPDIEAVSVRSRMESLQEIMECTHKPIVYDGDSGGNLDQTFYLAQTLARLGVAGLCIEDKIGRKRNSLYGTDAGNVQASVQDFSAKIRAAKKGAGVSDLMIIARIESLVLNVGIDDAVKRAVEYCDAGADAILIHSVSKSPHEIFEFGSMFRRIRPGVPLVAVPTAFDEVTAAELEANGFNVVVYANHLMRAALSSMRRAATDILAQDQGAAIQPYSATPKDLLSIFPAPEL